MPMPPPPADALTITGKPMSRAAATACSGSPTGSEVPRETGTPADATRLRARILSPMASIASGDGPTQTSPASRTRRAKPGILREEPVSRVDRLGAGLAGGLQQRVGVPIALRGCGRADADRVVGLAHVRQPGVRLRVHRDGAQAHPLDGPDDASGDLAAVGDEHGLEHGWLASPSEVGRQARLTGVVLVLVVAVAALAVSVATGGSRLAQGARPGRPAAGRGRDRPAGYVGTGARLRSSPGVPLWCSPRCSSACSCVGNARLPGVPLVALGLLLNVVVVGANAAMPVSVDAAARAGISRADLGLARDAMRTPSGPDTRLAYLGDVVPVALPRWPQVVSPGDVLVAAGVGLLLLTAGVRRPQTPRRAERSTVWVSDSTTFGSYS